MVILGSGFGESPTVLAGNTPCTVTWSNATRIECGLEKSVSSKGHGLSHMYPI